MSNRNQNLQWAKENNIRFDQRIEDEPDLRGIYGIFVGDECAYVGRAYGIYYRLFSGNCHIRDIRIGESNQKINNAFENGIQIEIKILEVVPLQEDNKAKDAQRLASRECYWIDYYQNKDQCLEQFPEGRWGE